MAPFPGSLKQEEKKKKSSDVPEIVVHPTRKNTYPSSPNHFFW